MSALVHHARRRAAPRPSEPRLRARIEAAIEWLIATLDALDGDPDIEDDSEGVNEDGDDLEGDEIDFGEAEGYEPSSIV